jgi:hypothetical protein
MEEINMLNSIVLMPYKVKVWYTINIILLYKDF